MKASESKYCQCLYFTTNALARKVEKLAVEAWKPVGLSPSHGYLLMMVIEEPGLQPGTLSDHLQLKPSTISRLMEKLEDKKMVVRVTEGKTTNVYATPAGKKLLPTLKECVNVFSKSCSAVLKEPENSQLMSGMMQLNDKLG